MVGATPTTVAIGDLNGDGRSDLAVSDPGSNAIFVMLNHGDVPTATLLTRFEADWAGDRVVTGTSLERVESLTGPWCGSRCWMCSGGGSPSWRAA
jgi:hypothetical protein